MKTLVLLPGYGFKSNVWDGFITQLSPSYNVIKIDITNDLSEVFFTLAKIPNQSYICGWSLGGMIATKFCTLFPENGHYLITLASSPNFQKVLNQDWVRKLKDVLKQDFNKFLNTLLCSVLYPNISISGVRSLSKYLITEVAYFQRYLDFLLSTNVYDDYKMLKSRSFHIIAERDSVVSHETLSQWQSNEFADIDSNAFIGHYPFSDNKILGAKIERWILQNKL